MIAMRDAARFHFMSGFFEELRRRKVYRVAAAYIIAAGFIIQIASAVFPAWELSNWTFRLLVTLLLIGFPIALILAWAFRRHAARNSSDKGNSRRNASSAQYDHSYCNRRDRLSCRRFLPLAARFRRARSTNRSRCCPFENLSDEKENAYFADGIQDDILTGLAKIGDLKVISRTSVMPYRGSAMRNARDIGKALGVATLLEGSVRRIGNRVRVNVQLINVNNDEHIWAEDYDRDLTDVFAIQTDLAGKNCLCSSSEAFAE